MLKPGQKRPKQAKIADLFQKPVKAKRIEGPELGSSASAENIELSPSPPSSLSGQIIELSPPLSGKNTDPSPSFSEGNINPSPELSQEIKDLSTSLPSTAAENSKLPKEATLNKWRKEFEWLEITERNTMICRICVSQKEKIILKNPSSSMGFINGASNFKMSALRGHSTSECHRTGVGESKHQNAIEAGLSLPKKRVVQTAPNDSHIASGLQKMGEKERSGLKKLMEVAYFIALKGRPFTDFKDMIELEKLHGVKFDTSAYENESACRDFIKSTASYLFDIDVRQKLTRVNFIAILVDGTTDRAVKEQEVLYVMYVDPDTHQPTLSYFEVMEMDEFDQSAVGMLRAIKSCFERHNLSELWEKLIYLSADGASVNSGKDSGLIAQIQAEHEWVLFVWCFSHRLELALKDALKKFTDPVDESLMHLYYLYHKSSKKLRELKSLFKDIKGDFEMYGDGVKPLKATGTRWIDHRIRAMGRLVDKFGLYTRHLKQFIDAEKNSKVKATVKGKLDKILDAQVLFRSAFLKDLLTPAKAFSLVTQKQNPSIMETVEGVEKTKRGYKKLLQKFKRDSNQVFELPTLKAVVTEIEGDGLDGDPVYQGQRLKYYGRGKQYIADNCAYLVQCILDCYDERYWFDDDDAEEMDGFTTNDHLIFSICKVLNASAWPKLPNDDSDDEEILKIQLESVSRVHQQFSAMKIFEKINKDDVVNGYIEVVRFCQRYLDYENSDPVELWHKVLLQYQDNPEWRGIALVIEICLCTPCSNATLERFFNHLKIVKTDQRTALSSSSLNSVLRVKLRQIPIKTFHDEYTDKIVSHWYNDKDRRIHQRKRKNYKKRVSSVTSRQEFDVVDFTLDDQSSDDDHDELFSSDDDLDDNDM